MKTTQMTGILLVAGTLVGGAAQAADIAKGEKVFRRCKACHQVEDGKNTVGPHLAGIVGRAVASVSDYNYSDAMVAYGSDGAVWDPARLDAYLTKPKDEVKGTKMAFAGLRKEAQRADLIAYLETIE